MIVMNISGNLTADAIVKNVNGNEVVNFTIASNNRYKGAGGEIKEEVTFINCSIWDKAEAAQYLYKGRSINAIGSLRLRKYVAGDGSNQTSLNLKVSFFQLFGKNKQNEVTTTTIEASTAQEITEPNDDLPF
jgi:single-strand DNA-binding protein